MPIAGKLTRASLGFSMPAHAPMYPAPPYVYDDARLVYYAYVTDAQKAAELLPQTVTVSDPPIATVTFATYPRSTLGQYLEVVHLVDVVFQDKPAKFAVALFVTSDAAMASGRELGGYPKKIAEITIREEGPSGLVRIARPIGLVLAEGIYSVGSPIEFHLPETHEYLCLRLIPSPRSGAVPSVCELVRSHWTLDSGELWSGSGSLRFTGASDSDPLHLLPILAPPQVMHFRGRITVDSEPANCQFPLP